jgi:hypothetical protein
MLYAAGSQDGTGDGCERCPRCLAAARQASNLPGCAGSPGSLRPQEGSSSQRRPRSPRQKPLSSTITTQQPRSNSPYAPTVRFYGQDDSYYPAYPNSSTAKNRHLVPKVMPAYPTKVGHTGVRLGVVRGCGVFGNVGSEPVNKLPLPNTDVEQCLRGAA